MKLEGSCHCGEVSFSLNSRTPYPFMYCYCSICRKTAGGGGYAINIMGLTKSLKLKGKKYCKTYRVRFPDPKRPGKTFLSSMRRFFCGKCGSALYGWDPNWPQGIYPFASAIDTPLPKAPERIHLMLNYAAPWVKIPKGKRDKSYSNFPDETILGWHKAHGLYGKK